MPPPHTHHAEVILLVPTASVVLWWTSVTQSQGQLRKPQGIQMGVKGVEEGEAGRRKERGSKGGAPFTEGLLSS